MTGTSPKPAAWEIIGPCDNCGWRGRFENTPHHAGIIGCPYCGNTIGRYNVEAEA